MNRISQKMIEIAEKLSKDGLKERAEQFIILAEDLEYENKMQKISNNKTIEVSSVNISEMIHSMSMDTLENKLEEIRERKKIRPNDAALEKTEEKIVNEINSRQASINSVKNIFNKPLTPYNKYKE